MFDANVSQLTLPLPSRTDVVQFTVLVDGVQIPDVMEVFSIQVERSFNRIPYCIIKFLDGDVSTQSFETGDQDILSPGREIEIKVGYLPNEDTIFKGIIIRHALKILPDRRPMVELECKDKAVKLTVKPKNKYFFDQTDAQVIESLARGVGLTTDIEDSNVNHTELVQFHVTDWDFLVLRAEANSFLVTAKDGQLIVKKPDLNQTEKFTINYGTSLYEFEAEMDARDQYPEARAITWSIESQEINEITASASGSGGGGLGISVPSAISSGVTAAGGALGVNLPDTPPNTDYTAVISNDGYEIRHSGYLTQEELQKWAEAQFQKSTLAKKRGRVRFQGIANIYPGDMISLQGVGKRYEGKVFITAIRHEIFEGTWFTHAQFGMAHKWFHQEYQDINQAPASGLIPAIHGMQIGVVTKLAPDPGNEFRIQITLPIIDDASDGIWARVALQDAGNNRSAFFLPEVGDEVIVGFINDDPRDAIVLGALHSSSKPSPFTAADENHQKGWWTRSGMKIVFDDDDNNRNLTIETPDGKKITIDDTNDVLQLEDQHGNRLVMDANGITIESAGTLSITAQQDITIEGMNITNTANSNFKSEGATRAEITSTAEVVINGGVVRIN